MFQKSSSQTALMSQITSPCFFKWNVKQSLFQIFESEKERKAKGSNRYELLMINSTAM